MAMATSIGAEIQTPAGHGRDRRRGQLDDADATVAADAVPVVWPQAEAPKRTRRRLA